MSKLPGKSKFNLRQAFKEAKKVKLIYWLISRKLRGQIEEVNCILIIIQFLFK